MTKAERRRQRTQLEEERQTFVDAVDGVAEQFRDEMGEEAWELYQTCITEAQG